MMGFFRGRPFIVVIMAAGILISAGCQTTGTSKSHGNFIKKGAILSYQEYQSSYKPHNKRPYSVNAAVKAAEKMPTEKLAGFFNHAAGDLSKPESRKILVGLSINLPRNQAGACFDLMERDKCITALNSLKDEWALDILYYMSEETYTAVARDVLPLKRYSEGSAFSGSHPKTADKMTAGPVKLFSLYKLGLGVMGNILTKGRDGDFAYMLKSSVEELGLNGIGSYQGAELIKMDRQVQEKYGKTAKAAFQLGVSMFSLKAKGKDLTDGFAIMTENYQAVFGGDNYLKLLSDKLQKQKVFSDSDIAEIRSELEGRLKKITVGPESAVASGLNFSILYKLGMSLAISVGTAGQNMQVETILKKTLSELGVKAPASFDEQEIIKMKDRVLKKYGRKGASAFQLALAMNSIRRLKGKALRARFNIFKKHYLILFGEDDYLKSLSDKIRNKTFTEKRSLAATMSDLEIRLSKMSLLPVAGKTSVPGDGLKLSSFYRLGMSVIGNILADGQNIEIEETLKSSLLELGLKDLNSYENEEIVRMNSQVKAKFGKKAGSAFQLGIAIASLRSLKGKELRDGFKLIRENYSAIFGEDACLKALSAKVRKKSDFSRRDISSIMSDLETRLAKVPVNPDI